MNICRRKYGEMMGWPLFGHGEVGPFLSFRRKVMALASRYRLEERTRGLHKQCANINLQVSILWRFLFFWKRKQRDKEK